MNSTKEKIKTVLIVLLVIGMFYLTYAVWFYDSPFGELRLDAFLNISDNRDVGAGAGSDLERFGIRPLAIAVADEAGTRGAIYKSESTDEIYNLLREVLSQSMRKSGALNPDSAASWLEALVSEGVLLDYRSDVPVSALQMWISETFDDRTLTGRYYIFSTKKSNVQIYVKNSSDGSIYSAETDVSSERLKEIISQISAESVTIAATQESEDFRAIYPEIILSGKEIALPTLSAYNNAQNFSTNTTAACLEVFKLRDATTSRYSEQDGSEVYVADRVTLKISPDGTAVYTDTREEADETLGIIVESEGETPTLAEKTEQARKISASLASKLSGDGGIYIASLAETPDGTEIVFGRHVDGVPVDMKGTMYFSSITIKGRSIRSARINLAGYSKTTKLSPLIPERIAAAAVRGTGKSGDLNIRYLDTGAGETSAAWYIGGIRKYGEKEAE